MHASLSQMLIDKDGRGGREALTAQSGVRDVERGCMISATGVSEKNYPSCTCSSLLKRLPFPQITPLLLPIRVAENSENQLQSLYDEKMNVQIGRP